jgi:hypothetical protein
MRIRPRSFPSLAVLIVISLAAAQTLTITHVNLIDVTDGKVRPNTTVTVEGNRIVKVEPSRAADTKRGLIVEGAGEYLIARGPPPGYPQYTRNQRRGRGRPLYVAGRH